MASAAVFDELAGLPSGAAPAFVAAERAAYARRRAAASVQLAELSALRDQLGAGAELPEDALLAYQRLRAGLFGELRAQIPAFKPLPARNQSEEIAQFLAFYTPESLAAELELRRAADLQHRLPRRDLARVGAQVHADYPLLEAQELGRAMRNTRPRGQPFQDQLNTFARANVIPGKLRSGAVPQQHRYKVGMKWWGPAQ